LKKTQEELDAEMEDYFNSGNGAGGSGTAVNSGTGASAEPGYDIDMGIE